MAPVQNLLHRWQEASGIDTDTDLATARRVTADRANALIVASQRAMTDCAIHTARLLGADRTVMTHSLSSTVLEVFRLLKSDGLRAIITESRPLEEGRQLAERLSAWGVPATYITDAQMGLFIAQADAVLVGADSVLTDGAVVNKAGTYLLALAAKEREIPFYVCCESFKRCGTDASPPELEEMACAELGVPGWPGVTVRNGRNSPQRLFRHHAYQAGEHLDRRNRRAPAQRRPTKNPAPRNRDRARRHVFSIVIKIEPSLT